MLSFLPSSKVRMTFTSDILVKLVLVSFVANSCPWAWAEGQSYLMDACNVTRYRNLCIHSLASYSSVAKTDPTKWARAGVSVTIAEAKSTTRYMMGLKKRHLMAGRNRVALFDCVEVSQDALDNLHKSLGVLRQLSAETFDTQMGDVTTWISSALTDQETCLDGFQGQNRKQIKMLKKRVTKLSCFTSNALALVAKLASSGP